MASRVVMPKLTDTMEEGVVVEWKKKEGDPVQAGDVIAEIETDKAVMDLEAFASGILRKVMAREGETVKAGALIGVIGEADEDITAAASDSITTSAAVKKDCRSEDARTGLPYRERLSNGRTPHDRIAPRESIGRRTRYRPFDHSRHRTGGTNCRGRRGESRRRDLTAMPAGT